MDVDLKNTNEDSASDGSSFCKESTPILFNQLTLNDLVRDLYLSKQLSELLASKAQRKYVREWNQDYILSQ